MYKVSIPISNAKITEQTREVYLRRWKQAGIDRVFLTIDRIFDERRYPQIQQQLRENAAWLRQNGIEPAIWLGCTVGHGGPLVGQQECQAVSEFTLMTTREGRELEGTFCPADEKFIDAVCAYVRALADCDVDTILLDDDIRLSQHGGFCCACDIHMKRMSELCGEEVKREDLMEKVFTGKPSRYRDAWLQVQGDSMRNYAKRLRQAVDEVNPKVRLALCSAHCVWDVDGTNPVELTHIFAGDNPPLLRLHGAPYWSATGPKPLGAVFEIARMFASFCEGEDFDLMAEGDVYPRPRYNVPASYLELFDGVIRADGKHQGILKYMDNYVSSPEYDGGYYAFHIRNISNMEKLEQMFAGGANYGVRVWETPNMMGQADFDLSCCRDTSPYPNGGIMLTRCGIPTVYSGQGICDAVFGENAREFDLNGKRGLLLDAAAAVILTQRGIDVGLERFGSYVNCGIGMEQFLEQNETAAHSGGECRLAKVDLRPGAVVESTAQVDGETRPVTYRYENEKSQRFFVCLFDGSSLNENSGLLHGFARQKQLQKAVQWLSGQQLAVSCLGNPELYVICRKDESGLTVGMFNCFADEIIPSVIDLAEDYTKVHWGIRKGMLEDNQVILPSIPAFGFDFFRLEK